MTREEAISINSMVETIATKVTEDTEKFIFETITPYCEEITKREILKKDLERALTQYFNKKPCDDAISRDMALEKMADYVASGYADSVEDFEEYSRIICQLPSVTQKPKTGHWIRITNGALIEKYMCSECHRVIEHGGIEALLTQYYPYCHCGAKMESEEQK